MPNRAHRPRRLIPALLLSLLIFASGCSGFHRAWKTAGATPEASGGMQGRWEGVWLSDHNGHTGRLRCLVTHRSNDVYQAWFHAKYQKIFSFAYRVTLEVTPGEGEFRFTGQENLGTLGGGLYEYAGSVEGTNFFSTYKSTHDHGTFRMGRPLGGNR